MPDLKDIPNWHSLTAGAASAALFTVKMGSSVGENPEYVLLLLLPGIPVAFLFLMFNNPKHTDEFDYGTSIALPFCALLWPLLLFTMLLGKPWKEREWIERAKVAESSHAERAGVEHQAEAIQPTPAIPVATADEEPVERSSPAADIDMWRDRKYLVLRRRKSPGNRCLKCNAPATHQFRTRVMEYEDPEKGDIPVSFFLGYLSIFLRGSAVLRIPLCDDHWNAEASYTRQVRALIAIPIALACMATFLFLMFGDNTIAGAAAIFLAGLAMMLFGIGLLMKLAREPILKSPNITKQFIWLEGVSPECLVDLPNVDRPNVRKKAT